MEIYFFCFNFTLFSLLGYSFFQRKIDFGNLVKFLIQIVVFSTLFYLFFKNSDFFGLELISLKKQFFNFRYLLVLFLFSILFYFFLNKENSILFKTFYLFSSIYFFFYLFGVEEFGFSNSIESLKLLKTQNLFIGFFSLILILIPSRSIRFLSSFFILFLLFFIISEQKKNNFGEIHQVYLPNEFWRDESFLVEEENGIYILKQKDKDDQYFKFSIKSIPIENIQLKEQALFYVSNFEFPVLIEENNFLIIYELKRSFKNENFKVILDIHTNKKKLEGPIF